MQWKPPCNTVSERSPSPTIWGKVSPNEPLLAGTQTTPSSPHPGLKKIQRWSWPLPVWLLPPPAPSRSTRGHIPITHGPSRLWRRSSAFSARVVKYWNRLPAPLVTLSVYLFKKQLDHQLSKIFPLAHVEMLFPITDIFLYIVAPDCLCFPFTPSTDLLMRLLLAPVANSTFNQ